MDADELALLRSPRLVAAVAAEPDGGDPLVRTTALRRAGLSPVEATLVLTQAALRRRARAKFGAQAERMLFTRAGLEQATRLPVARLHAARIAAAAATVADLGCGIGGDAIAFAEAGLEVLAVDRDPVTAALARINLAPWPHARVMAADARTTDLSGVDAVWLDPARRTEGHSGTRRVGVADYSPPLDFGLETAARHPVGMKLGPAFPHAELPPGVEAQWIGAGRETVELVLWTGGLERPGVGRAALLQSASGTHELTSAGDTADEPPGPLGGWLHEPHGAVLRAGLMGDLARTTGTRPVGPGIGYLTGGEPLGSPFATSFAIEAVLPFDRSAIRRELRARGIGRLEVKKRGVDLDPGPFRASLGLRGDAEATLVVTRTSDRRVALLCRRVPTSSSTTPTTPPPR